MTSLVPPLSARLHLLHVGHGKVEGEWHGDIGWHIILPQTAIVVHCPGNREVEKRATSRFRAGCSRPLASDLTVSAIGRWTFHHRRARQSDTHRLVPCACHDGPMLGPAGGSKEFASALGGRGDD